MLIMIGPDKIPYEISSALIWVIVAISIAITLVFYALRSIGLYTMAKKREIKHSFIAFIPLVWMYTACKLIGETKFFNRPFEKLAIWFCIIFSVGEFLALAYEFIIYFPIVGNFLAGNELYLIADTQGVEAILSEYDLVPMVWSNMGIYGKKNGFISYIDLGIFPEVINPIMTTIYFVSMIFDLAVIIINITLYINLFKKYVPAHFILFAVFSWLGLFAPLIFAVRKREPINYQDFIKQRYNAWYAGGSAYGGTYQPPKTDVPPTPFEEFADKDEIDPGDPFSEFNRAEQKKEETDDRKDN